MSVIIPKGKASIMTMEADVNKVVLGTRPGALLLYDVREKTGERDNPVWSWEDNTAAVNTLQFNNKCCITGNNNNGKSAYMPLGSSDGSIKRFDWRMIKQKDLSPTLCTLRTAVHQLAFEGDRTVLIARDSQFSLWQFDLETGEYVAQTKQGRGHNIPARQLFMCDGILYYATVSGIAAWDSQSLKKTLLLRFKPTISDFTGDTPQMPFFL